MTSPSQLGRLERLDVRTCWLGEASDFTPWLAKPENMALLAETIGMELEVQEQECKVGPFRADIVCSQTGSDHKVLIESQLERTDHSHLGQLMTYAAGLDAVNIVWIAERFTEEHRAALDWLNRITGEGINFFGLEIELWRIGGSPPAPKFNLVAKPNEWTQAVKRTQAASKTDALYLEYWTAFRDLMQQSKTFIRMQKPQGQTWTVVSIGRSEFVLTVTVSRQRQSAYVQLVIYEPNRLEHFNELKAQQQVIEAALGSGLEWRETDAATESHIRRNFDSFDLDNREDWPRQQELLREALEAFYRYFSPRVKTIGRGTKPEVVAT